MSPEQYEAKRRAVDDLLQRRGAAILEHVRAQDAQLGYQVGMLLGEIARLLDINDPEFQPWREK
jgi:hypothetical protein